MQEFTTLELSLYEVDLIETTIRKRLNDLSIEMLDKNFACELTAKRQQKALIKVLSQIHNERIWYRPEDDRYISG